MNFFYSLKYRIAFVVFILEVIMLATVLTQMNSHIRSQSKISFEERKSVIYEITRNIARNSLFSEEYDDLQLFFDKLTQYPEITGAMAINNKGVIVAHSDFNHVGTYSPYSEDDFLSQGIIGKLGGVKIDFSLKHIDNQLVNAINHGWVIAITGMVIISIIGVVFGTVLTRRLTKISFAASKFNHSRAFEPVKISGNDEISTLGKAFNGMSSEIKKHVDELQNERDNLEERIKLRTKDLQYSKNKLSIANKKLLELASTDHLTGLYNRVKLDEYLTVLYRDFNRHDRLYSVILIDIDNFKLINDRYGHTIGDSVLKEFSTILNLETRETDIVGRWGGEEFIVISPNTDLNGSYVLAEKLRKTIANNNFSTVKTVTCSCGVAVINKDLSPKQLIVQADRLLYKAKDSGRNQVCES